MYPADYCRDCAAATKASPVSTMCESCLAIRGALDAAREALRNASTPTGSVVVPLPPRGPNRAARRRAMFARKGSR